MARRGREAGLVTAETATVMPFVVLLTLALVWVVSLGLTQVRLTDAAREGARLVARGEPETTAVAAAERNAPDGSTVAVDVDGGIATVRVTSRRELPIPFFHGVGARTLRAESVAVLESP